MYLSLSNTTMEIAPPLWQINIRKDPIEGYFHSSIYTMEIAPPQWTFNIEKCPIGGYFHSNILFPIPRCIVHRDTVHVHYISMQIAPTGDFPF